MAAGTLVYKNFALCPSLVLKTIQHQQVSSTASGRVASGSRGRLLKCVSEHKCLSLFTCLRKDEDHCVVVVLERQTDDLSSGGRLEIAAGQSFTLKELDADPTLGVVADSEEFSREGDRVELGLPLRLEVQDVDQDEAGVGVDAVWKPKYTHLVSGSAKLLLTEYRSLTQLQHIINLPNDKLNKKNSFVTILVKRDCNKSIEISKNKVPFKKFFFIETKGWKSLFVFKTTRMRAAVDGENNNAFDQNEVKKELPCHLVVSTFLV